MTTGRRFVARPSGRAGRTVSKRIVPIVLAGVVSTAVLAATFPILTLGHDRLNAQSLEEPCVLHAERRFEPLEPVLGAEIAITTSLKTVCSPDTRPIHLVLLVDASEEMIGEPLRDLQSGLERALRGVDIHPGDPTRIGVAAFGDDAVVERALTSDIDQVIAGLHDIEAGGVPCLDCGLDEALKMLRAGRLGGPKEDFREVVLLLSQGVEVECGSVREKADELKRVDVVLVVACQGRECDRGCLADTATARRYFFSMSAWTELEFRLRELFHSEGAFHPIERVIMVDALADELVYLGGGEPTGAEAKRLLWLFEPWSTDVLTRTFRAGVVDCGRFELGKADEIGVTVEYNTAFWDDSAGGNSFEHPLPNPILEVRCAVPSPTPTVPTPTGASPTIPATTPTPTTSVTPPTAVPTTATPPIVWSAHLPIALAEACSPSPKAVDLVIAIDVSHSMFTTAVEGVGSVGGAWRAAALVAASTVEGLRTEVDRVGVLVYGDLVEDDGVVRPIQPCCAPGLIPAPGAFWKRDGSRIDLAIMGALDMFEAAPITSGADRALVVLTDGDLNQTLAGELEEALVSAASSHVSIDVLVFGGGEAGLLMDTVETIGGSSRRLERVEPGRTSWRSVRDLCR